MCFEFTNRYPNNKVSQQKSLPFFCADCIMKKACILVMPFAFTKISKILNWTTCSTSLGWIAQNQQKTEEYLIGIEQNACLLIMLLYCIETYCLSFLLLFSITVSKTLYSNENKNTDINQLFHSIILVDPIRINCVISLTLTTSPKQKSTVIYCNNSALQLVPICTYVQVFSEH